MKYLEITYVDVKTRLSVDVQPAKTGPVHPTIDGLSIEFSLESEYPTYVPKFYGTCPDGSDTTVSGVLRELTLEQYNEIKSTELDKQKRMKKNQIESLRYQKIYTTFSYTFPGDSEPDGVQVRNEVDRQNLQDFHANCMKLDPATTVNFMPESNNLKTMTAAEGVAMAGSIYDLSLDIMQHS